MSKVLQVVAIVAAVAATIVTAGAAAPVLLGVKLSATALTLISVATSIGATLLAPKPNFTQTSDQNAERLRATIDPRTGRKTSVGTTALAADIRDEEFTNDQKTLHRWIVVAAHEIESFDEIWFDDEKAWDSGGGVTTKFSGYLTVKTVTEGSSGSVDNISARMGATRIYEGLAYVYLKYELDGNTDDAESPFMQRVTNRVTIRGKGAKIYDPRLDTTVTGGSGSQRADDQSTWVWDNDDCNNPALQLLFYLLGYRITNPVTSDEVLSVGLGIPPDRIDLESFITAANICDETVNKPVSGTEPRYRSAGVWSEEDDPTVVIDMLKSTMNADLDDVDGKLRLFIFKNDLASVEADFDEGDILNDFEWTPFVSLQDRRNVVRGLYTDASDDALYQAVDYPTVSVTSPDGIDRMETLNLPMIESVGQAQRVAALRLLRMQYNGVFRATFQATAWAVQKNDIVRITFGPLGFVNKLFRVIQMEHNADGTVPMILRAEDANIYTTPTLLAAIDAAANTPYDPNLDVVVEKLNGFEISGPAEVLIATESDGTLKDGQVNPRYVQFFAKRNGVDVTQDATWSITVPSAYQAAAISNATDTEGRMNITMADASGLITVRAELGAQFAEWVCKVTRQLDPPPVTGEAGGTASSGTINTTFTSNTMVAIGPELTIDSGTGGNIDLTCTYSFNNFDNPVNDFEAMFAQWYWWNGSSYVAKGSEVKSTQNCFFFEFPDPEYVDGEGAINYTDSPGASQTEKYKVYGRCGTNNQLKAYGNCSGVGS